MDSLKKLVADRLKTQVAGPHPDAEVLSAFAENALPANERETVLQHLSTCSDCRDVVFLAAPLASESQQVISAPKTRPVFALRWGTLAAGILIAAVFLVSRHEAPQREQVAKTVPQTTSPAAPPAAATDAIVAAEKTPAEFYEMRDKLPATVHVPSSTGHAAPKHITAKPEGNMSFADSGEVSVNAPAVENARVEPRTIQSLQTNGRSVADLKQISPGAAQAASTPAAGIGTGRGVAGGEVAGMNIGGPVAANARPYAAYGADFSKKDTALHGYVAGTVFDASGAVIPNVKVTALGPLGTKTATSDWSGKYALDQLAAGNYELKFNAPGFTQTEFRQVAVLADKPANLDVKLSPGAATETITVEAAAPQIVQQAQQTELQSNEQQQNANEIQSQEITVEAAAVKVQKAAKHKGARSSTQPLPALAKALPPVWQWSLSPGGIVQRSSDNGKNWQPVAVNAKAVFRAISSLGPEIWAAGNAGALYHSTDSGLHWTQVLPSTAGEKLQSDITQVQFTDPQHLTLTTSDSQVWTTADGGQTWSRK